MNNEVQRDEITVNVARGLTAIARNFVRTIPHGEEIWNKGLGSLAQSFIEKHPSVPAGELTLEQFAQHIGVLPEGKTKRDRPRQTETEARQKRDRSETSRGAF